LFSLPEGHEFTPVSYQWSRDCFPFRKDMSSLPYPISGAGTAFPSWRKWVYSRILSVEQGVFSLPEGHEFTPVSYQWSRDCLPFLKDMSLLPFVFMSCVLRSIFSFLKKNTLNIFYCQELYKQWIRNKLSTYEVFFVTYKSLKRQHITNTWQFSVYYFIDHFLSLCLLYFVIVLSVHLGFTASDYPFGIFKHFFYYPSCVYIE
jgi:hypothetical protein